jgi:hypothetical protein
MKKLPRRFAKAIVSFERLFLAISVKHLKASPRYTPLALPVK